MNQLRAHLARRPRYWRPAWTYPRRDMRRFMRRPFYIDIGWEVRAWLGEKFLGECPLCGRRSGHKMFCGRGSW